MPCKYRQKSYEPNAFYHIFNRGVERRIIYNDKQDYQTFLSYLQFYLTDENSLRGPSPNSTYYPSQQLLNHSSSISLVSYCLMPNHFHLLIQQKDADSIVGFMRSLSTRYSMYFNKRYSRVGSLFQGRYKAILIDNESYLTHLSRYIHLNASSLYSPSDSPTSSSISDYLAYYPWSSLKNYLGIITQSWIKPDMVLNLFSNTEANSYKEFIDSHIDSDSEVLDKKYLIDAA